MSTRGPKILTFTGIGLLIVGIVVSVVSFTGMLSLASGVFDPQGQPETNALLSFEAFETGDLDSSGDTSYILWEVTSSSYRNLLRPSDVEVFGPDGEEISVLPSSVPSYVSHGEVHGRTFAQFRASEPGKYQITVPLGSDRKAGELDRVIVADASDSMGNSFRDTGLVIVSIGGVLVGFVLTVGGSIWWVVSRNRRKRAGGGPRPVSRRSGLVL